MKDKIIEFFDKSVTSQIVLKRIAVYLLIICVLLGLVFYKLCEINNNLTLATENIISSYNDKKEEAVLDVYVDKFDINDSLPLHKEYDKTSSTTNIDENTTNELKEENSTEVSTTNSDTLKKYDFVININSKKIHYADCTFVSRMKEENKQSIQLNQTELSDYLNNGYKLCSTCGG